MSIRYESLDAEVRVYMAQELQRDLGDAGIYISNRLTPAGKDAWPGTLGEAIQRHDDEWLAATLRSRSYMLAEEQRQKPKGGITVAKVPETAPDTLAEGEFNRYYARGLCAQVLATGGTEVEVYRGKTASSPRPESEAMLGKHLKAQALLDDLRAATRGVETAMGIPAGPNSGLTVRRIP